MKKYFSRLFNIGTYCNLKYTFNSKTGLSSLAKVKEKRSGPNVCMLERGVYWQAERQYDNINIIDLPKLIKAETLIIAPFSGRVFWKIKKLSSNQALVQYIAVPTKYIEVIASKCKFIYPQDLGEPSKFGAINANLNLDLLFDSNVKSNTTDALKIIGKAKVFNLAGFYIAKSKAAKVQRLSLKNLALFVCVSFLVFVLASSAYLSFNLSSVESKLANNNNAVEEALKTQRELKAQFESKKDFEDFFLENKNVLGLFSHLNFKKEKYRIDRVHLHPKGFKITGTSETSATNLLTILLNHPKISEAKFDRSVAKNRAGEDVFVIVVIFS